MEIIALANQKGGVAKTTSTYNLAALKAQQGKRVLMVDLDPQASLTILCGIMPGKEKYSVCDLFDLNTDPFECGYEVEKSGLESLYIIPSDIDLAEVEQILSARYEREKILKKQLSKLEPKLAKVEESYISKLKTVPNVPEDDVPVGLSEDENEVAEVVKESFLST